MAQRRKHVKYTATFEEQRKKLGNSKRPPNSNLPAVWPESYFCGELGGPRRRRTSMLG
jgi:hypothetical protein